MDKKNIIIKNNTNLFESTLLSDYCVLVFMLSTYLVK